MVHSIWSKLSCVVGTVTGLPVTIAELESSIQRMTKELAETVKAIIDSKMGGLGSVCVLSVEEFIGKLKKAMEHLAASSVPGGSVEQAVTSVPSVRLEAPGSPLDASSSRSVSLSQVSDVPTAFAGVRSVASKEGGISTSATAKPGKKSQKIMGGVLVLALRLRITIYDTSFFWSLLFSIVGRNKKVKTLKPAYFVSGVVGTFVGFPRHKRVVDGYARCLLCKVDLSIAGRGLSSLWEHWRGVEHTRVEQKFRIMMQMPLLDKACRPVSAEEDRRIRRARMTEPPVFLESELSLSVDERVAIEEAEAVAGGKPVLGEESVSFLWLSQFVSSFCSTTTFRDVMQMVESWRDTMNTELRVECRTLTYTRCQVCIYISSCRFLFVCDEVI